MNLISNKLVDGDRFYGRQTIAEFKSQLGIEFESISADFRRISFEISYKWFVGCIVHEILPQNYVSIYCWVVSIPLASSNTRHIATIIIIIIRNNSCNKIDGHDEMYKRTSLYGCYWCLIVWQSTNYTSFAAQPKRRRWTRKIKCRQLEKSQKYIRDEAHTEHTRD